MMASNPNYSLFDPNQQNWMQQGQAGVMAPYQPPAYQPPPQDWGMSNYMQNLSQGGSTGLDFGSNGTGGFAPNQTGNFKMPWGKLQSSFGLANAALSTLGIIQGISQNRSDAKLRKNSAQQGFNANAILANNAIRQRGNAGRAFSQAHGVDYTAPHTPLKMIQGWGKSGAGVGT